MNQIPYRTYLNETQMPKSWYNLRADISEKHDPCLNPATQKPIALGELESVFVSAAAGQELDFSTRFIDIPDEVAQFYKTFRPSPLVRAYNLEKALDTPAKIYYKFEGNNTSGSHKLNAAAAVAYYAKEQGLTSLTTETGAGQWGTALAMACAFYGLDLTVFMVKVSAEQKPYRKAVMDTYGAKVIPSPSLTTAAGRKILEEHPGTGGSLGCAVSEAIELAAGRDSCKYVLGSVLDHVCLYQSIIGLEAKTAMEVLDEYPDVIVGCAGGGSNLMGLMAPFMGDKLSGKADPRVVAVEPASCPSLTRGVYAYDFCDVARITPLTRMYTLGSSFLPSPDHAGGLRFHGMSPTLSQLKHMDMLEAISVKQSEVFRTAELFCKHEQILPAPESAHAIHGAVLEALRCKQSGEAKTILFGLTGTGYFDMQAYMKYQGGELCDHIPSDEDIAASLAQLPQIR